MTSDQTPPVGPATRAQWGEAMFQATESLSRLSTLPCPNCGAKTLRVVFVGLPDIHAASGFLWCDTCLQGIVVSRMGVPEDGEIISYTLPREQWPVTMPEYKVVWE